PSRAPPPPARRARPPPPASPPAPATAPAPSPPTLPMPVPRSALEEPVKAIQLYDSYLVVETEAGMLVIDQHALHERILFEQFRARIRAGQLQTQMLLIPEPIDLTLEAAGRVLEVREALGDLGLGVEDFGGGTVLLTRYPILLGKRSPRLVFQAVVDHLLSKDTVPA